MGKRIEEGYLVKVVWFLDIDMETTKKLRDAEILGQWLLGQKECMRELNRTCRDIEETLFWQEQADIPEWQCF